MVSDQSALFVLVFLVLLSILQSIPLPLYVTRSDGNSMGRSMDVSSLPLTNEKSEGTIALIKSGGEKVKITPILIFAGAFLENYEPLSGFYFEVDDDSPVVQENMGLFDYNFQDCVNGFVAAALAQVT
ncbi:hypothetical protein AgCh_015590 [Apium graveolens]